MTSSRESAAVTPFGASEDHSFFTAELRAAVVQSITPRRQPIPRLGLSARGGASIPARSPSVHLVMCAVWVFLCSGPPFCGSARAEPASIPVAASPRSALPFSAFVAEASQRFSIPANWIRAVMRIESAGDVRAVSPKGAMGLMQIMPKTYAGLRARHHLGPDAYDPRDNILAGAAYLREMLDRYGSPGFLAAYNAGPARYDEHLQTGRPLPTETQVYVAILSPMIGGREFDDRTGAPFDLIAWARATLFATHTEASPIADLPAAKVQPDRPPSVRRILDLSALSPRSEGLFVHLRRRGPSAMSKIAFRRALAGFVGRSAVGLSRWGESDHGRQDKSAACGQAHVVGWVGDFRHLGHACCWRFCRQHQRFQCLKRHPCDRQVRLRP